MEVVPFLLFDVKGSKIRLGDQKGIRRAIGHRDPTRGSCRRLVHNSDAAGGHGSGRCRSWGRHVAVSGQEARSLVGVDEVKEGARRRGE